MLFALFPYHHFWKKSCLAPICGGANTAGGPAGRVQDTVAGAGRDLTGPKGPPALTYPDCRLIPVVCMKSVGVI